jgi:regulator of protease activity HflC (stomatin/prohibitin superfamily)
MLDLLFSSGLLIPIILILFFFVASALKVVREYERLVVFRLGRLIGQKGPGLVFMIPVVDRFVRISLRIITLDVPTQEVITRDNVTTSVNAVVYYRVIDPNRAVNNVEEYKMATAQLAQTTLRSVAGQADLDELLSERDKLNQKIQAFWMKRQIPGGSRSQRWRSRMSGFPKRSAESDFEAGHCRT